MFSLISEAHAADAPAPAATTASVGAAPAPQGPASNTMEGALMQFAPLFLIFAVFYFMLIRPQQKRYKEHQALLEGLRRGDKVVTSGGIVGTVVRIEDEHHAVVEIAPNVHATMKKAHITAIDAKPEPAEAKKD